MTAKVITIVGQPTAAEAAAFVAATLPPGRYYVEPLPGHTMAKATTVSTQDEFETWFLRELYRRSRDHFQSSQAAIWNVLDNFLADQGVTAPSQLDYWDLQRTLFDLSTASTARMSGFRIPPDLAHRLEILRFTVPEMLDFPALAYRMGKIYDRLNHRPPASWAELRQLAADVPLTTAERAAAEHARLNAGMRLKPIFDDAGRLWTAQREVEPIRRITSSAIEQREGTMDAVRELERSNRAAGIGRDAERVIRTEIAEARSRGLWDTGVAQQAASTKLYRLTSPNACRGCLKLYRNPDGTPRLYTHAEVAAGDASGWNDGHWRDWHPRVGPTHANCFPAGTVVSTPGAPFRGFDRIYRGDVITIKTESGHEITCTPNHPILTPGGWSPAGALYVRGEIISGRFDDRMAGRDMNGNDAPSLIEDVVNSLGFSGEMASRPVPVSPEDFHGDGVGSEIAIIRTNRFLRDNSNTACLQHRAELALWFAWLRWVLLSPQRASAQLIERSRHAPNCRMRVSGVGMPLFSGEPRVSYELGIMARAGFYSLLLKDAIHDASCDLHGESDAEYGLSVREPRNDPTLINNQAPGFVTFADGHDPMPSRLEGMGEAMARNPSPGGDTSEANSRMVLARDGRDIKVTRVSSLGVRRFEGHVYNLSTAGQVYSANGIIVHNCVCSPWARWLPALAAMHARMAPPVAARMSDLKVFEERKAA